MLDRLPNEDILYLALANLKEVKDVLKGHIKPDRVGFQRHSEPDTVDLSYADLGKRVCAVTRWF